MYKTSRLVRISLSISALNKRESYSIKAIENFFPVFVYPDINTRGAGRILDIYANPRLPVCITVSNSPNPSRVYIRLCKHGKRFLLLNWTLGIGLTFINLTMGEKIINMKNEKGCHVVKTTINLCIIFKEIGRVNLAINERGLVGYEELSRSRRVLSEVDNSLRGLLDSSYPTKAEFINYFIIHSK